MPCNGGRESFRAAGESGPQGEKRAAAAVCGGKGLPPSIVNTLAYLSTTVLTPFELELLSPFLLLIISLRYTLPTMCLWISAFLAIGDLPRDERT